MKGLDTVQSSITYTLGAEIENLTLTGNGSINGTGNALDNVLTGNSGNNTLNGGAGADTLIGGTGTDTASYAASLAGVNVSWMTGTGVGAMRKATRSPRSKISLVPTSMTRWKAMRGRTS